jgi:hypothetical protein
MEKLLLKYRTWYLGLPPQPIKLQIPGWAGHDRNHEDGAKPQPWHCPPFVEASTYGLEMIYPFNTECHVKNDNGTLQFLGDFSSEAVEGVKFPPFQIFAEGHYGYTSAIDIQAPPGHVIRIEPHPRFYTDQTGTVPIPVAGHLQTEWWPKIFFVVFKVPRPGETHIFRKGEGYAQMLVLPKKVSYEIREMDQEERSEREKLDSGISKGGPKISKHTWKDHLGNVFDDKYKQLRLAHETGGQEQVKKVVTEAVQDVKVEKNPRLKKPPTVTSPLVRVKRRP